MDLPILQATVRGGLSGTTYSLAATALGTDATDINTLFATVFATHTLALTNATTQSNLPEPVVTGTLSGAPQANLPFLAGMVVTATFWLDAAQHPQLHLVLVRPKTQPWTLLDTMAGWQHSLLGNFDWSAAQIEFNSTAPALLPMSFPAAYGFPAPTNSGGHTTGMQLTSTVAYKNTRAALTWLVGTDPIPVTGPVIWVDAIPIMDLSSSPLSSLTVDGFTLSVSLHLVSVLIDLPAVGSAPASVMAVPVVALTGTLERPTSTAGSLQIPFTIVSAQDPEHLLLVTGDFQEASSLALDDIAQLLGVCSVATQQASQFPTLQDLSLQKVVLAVNPSDRALVFASATVDFQPADGHWPAKNDILMFEGFAITFTAVGPLASPSLETVIDTKAKLGNGTLDAQLSLPSLDFCCELADGSTFDLTELISRLIGSHVFGSFQLICSQLKVLGNTAEGTYRFQATVQENGASWNLPVLPGTSAAVGLTSVGFDITHQQPANGTALTAGQVVAQFTIAGTQLQVAADLPTVTKGWSFSGGTMGKQNIELKALLNDILQIFALQLPSATPQVTITDLQLMLQTGTTAVDPMSFGFSCDAEIELFDTTVGIDVEVGRTYNEADTKPTTIFTGYIYVGTATFEVDFTAAPTSKSLLFKWSDTETPLTFEEVAAFFKFDMPPLPEALDLSLTEAEFYYDFTSKTVACSATSKHGSISFYSFVGDPDSAAPSTRYYVFALDIELNMSFAKLPIVGPNIPKALNVCVQKLQVLVANQALNTDDLGQLTPLLALLNAKPLIATKVAKGLTFAAELTLGDTLHPLVLPLSSASSTPAPAPAPTAMALAGDTPPSYQGQTKWFTVGKAMGPLSLQRIGVQYQDSQLFFLLDASLSLSAITLGMDGLGLGSPLTNFRPAFHLDGISVAFSSGPVTIDGGLLHVPTSSNSGISDDWIGEVTIALAPYLISGAAGYSRVNDHPSFFVFAQIQGEFGGPPAFFITGFMGGFGYNSQLTLPDPTTVSTFPFVAGLDDPTIFGSATPSPLNVMNALSGAGGKTAWLTPTVGENWAAAGVMFRSFELVLGKVLLVATFGKEFELALLGLASMSLPQGATTDAYAYVELQLEATFKPSEGALSVIASLTPNSYLLTKDCHLTGGFAYCMWFGENPHSGDFVVTIGGYHPAFVVPAWYPQVAPVGFNWPVDGNVTVKGGAYFALTPTAAMAGGNLEVLYQSGDLHAWFTAYANIMVRWKPFYFTAGIGISLGASYRLSLFFTTVTISIELGANLDLWGPPTGGIVHIHWYIISFSVSFGSGPADAATLTLDWSDFQALLPNNPAPAASATSGTANTTPAVLGVNITGGLIRQDSNGGWTVRADELVISAHTAVPATSLMSEQTVVESTSALVNIRPMNLSGVTSTFTVSLQPPEQNLPGLTNWTVVAQQSNLPEALWGVPLETADPAPSAATVHDLLTGFVLRAPAAEAGPTVGPFDPSTLVDPSGGGYLPLTAASQQDLLPVPAASDAVIKALMQDFAATLPAQQSLVTALTSLGAAPPTYAPLVQLAQNAGRLLADEPLLIA